MDAVVDPAFRLNQYWDKPVPPPEVQRLMQLWSLRIGTGYTSYDAGSAQRLIAENFPPHVEAAFSRCAVPAMQADLFRYCLLYVEGGIYVDADTEPLGDLCALARTAARAMLMIRRDRVANDVMFFRHPADPLLGRTIEMAIENIARGTSNDVWSVTGPGIMTKLHNNAESASLFDGIDLRPVSEIGRAVRFVWDLNYKKGNDHWRRKKGDLRSIYRNPDEPGL